MFNVDLVHDASTWWHNAEFVECRLAPAKELVALAVTFVFKPDVQCKCFISSEVIGDDTVIDDKFSRGQRVNARWVSPKVFHCLAHGGKVNHTRHTSEVLHDHPCRRELNLISGFTSGIPVAQAANVIGGDVGTIFGTQQVL